MGKFFKWSLRTIFLLFFVLSITLNISGFIGSALWQTASIALTGVTGIRSFTAQQTQVIIDERSKRKFAQASASRAIDEKDLAERNLKRTQLDLVTEKRLRKTANKQLVDANTEIVSHKRTVRKLKTAADPFLKSVTYKGRKMALKEAVSDTTNAISKRAAKSATRELASMPAESLPVWGTAVIVAITAIELKDLCDTIKDMNALKRAFNPELAPSEDEVTVCSMKVPSKEEVWSKASQAPGQAWNTARKATPSLAEIKEWKLPEVDYNALWVSTKSGTASYTSWGSQIVTDTAKGVWSSTQEKAGTALDATKLGIKSVSDNLPNILNGDD